MVKWTSAAQSRLVKKRAIWVQELATTPGTVSGFMDPGRVITHAASLKSKGLIGDVFLRSRPIGARVGDVFVRTSIRKKEVALDVELVDVKQAGKVQFVAEMLDSKGAVEQTFSVEANVTADQTQKVTVSWPWPNPRLWDVGQPNLYTLRLTVKGSGLDDAYSQEFGFREFWIDGKKFFLNGSEIHLRPNAHNWTEVLFSGSSELIDDHIDGCIRARLQHGGNVAGQPL